MSSYSESCMEMISHCEPVQGAADKPLANRCEGLNKKPNTEEITTLDSLACNPKEETLSSSQASPAEDDDTQPLTCNHTETVQSTSNVHDEDPKETNSEDTRDLQPSQLVKVKHQVTVDRRTMIITRLDGVNLSTGSEVSFYKCHLCGKLFSRLAELPNHLSTHSPQQLTLYQCLLCKGSYSFKTKLLQHLRIHHNIDLPRRSEISETDRCSRSSESLLSPSGVAGGPDCDLKTVSQKNDEFLQSVADIALHASEEESDIFSASQFRMLHLSMESSNSIPKDQFVLEKLHLGKLLNDQRSLFHCDPAKSLTEAKSFLCQMCGFESRRRSLLLHHIIKHHLDSIAVQKIRKQLLQRGKFRLPHRMLDSNFLRKFTNGRELKKVLSETSNCLTSAAVENGIFTSTSATESKRDPLHLCVSPKRAECFSENDWLCDTSTGRPDTVLNKTDDLQDSPETKYSEMGEACHTADQLENEKLGITPTPSATSTEQWNVMENKAVGLSSSLVSMHALRSICNTAPSQLDAISSTSSSVMTTSTLSTPQKTVSECKPLVFSPSNISPLLHGFLPLPFLSLFLSQSAHSPASFLGTNDSNFQFPLAPVKFSQENFNEKISASRTSNSWDQASKFDASEEEDVKPSRAVLDWRALVRNQMRGLSSRGSSTLNANAEYNQEQHLEAFKPIITSDGQAVYRCTYCSKDFSTVSDITRHMEFHEDVRPYRCTHCDYHARTNSQLKVHMMRHQGIRKFHCRLCNYKGVTQSDLNRHAKSQIHMLKARNQCESCGEGFVSPINLGKHYHERHFSPKTETNLDLNCRQ